MKREMFIAFGGMGKGPIIDICKIGNPFLPYIDNVLCLEELKYN